MNGTTTNNINHPLYMHYPTLIPVISGKQIAFETSKQQAIQHYEDFILSIIKVMDLQYITHCTDKEY